MPEQRVRKFNMRLHKWLTNRSLSLDDALGEIKDEAIKRQLSKFLADEDNVAAYEQLLDAVDAAIAREPKVNDLDLLIQLRDDLTYFPEEIVAQIRE